MSNSTKPGYGRFYIMFTGVEWDLVHFYGGAYFLHTDNEQGKGGWTRIDCPPLKLLKPVDNLAMGF